MASGDGGNAGSRFGGGGAGGTGGGAGFLGTSGDSGGNGVVVLNGEFSENTCSGRLVALTAIRYAAQNSVAIGVTADITGLEGAGGSIENDPQRSVGRPFCRDAQRRSRPTMC
jgi:hypothetical protein